MDTRLLEDALVLLEERSFSAAAARRNVTQPAFSRRIRALEYWLGRDLLVRGPNRITISPSLEACEPKIRAMLAHLHQLKVQLQDPENAEEPLVFSTQHSLSLSVFPEICQILSTLWPNVIARLRTQNQDIATSIFLRKEADILIAYEHRGHSRLPFDDSIVRQVWRRDVMVPVVGGPLCHQVTAEKLLPERCKVIDYPADSFFGQIIREARSGVPLEGETTVESAFSMGVARLVLAGIGAAWLPHSIIGSEIPTGNAMILSAAYGRIPLDIVLFVHGSNERAVGLLEQLSPSAMGPQ